MIGSGFYENEGDYDDSGDDDYWEGQATAEEDSKHAHADKLAWEQLCEDVRISLQSLPTDCGHVAAWDIVSTSGLEEREYHQRMDEEEYISAQGARRRRSFSLDSGDPVTLADVRECSLPKGDWEPVLAALLEELPLAQAVKLACKATGAPRNEVYPRALELSRAAQDHD